MKMTQKKNKVLLVGWDSADWKVIDKLMEKGLMPSIKSIVDNGVRGKIATLDPPLSPMLWTSMATGVRPFKHGVLGFVEHDGAGGVRPVSSHSRKVKAIWNMLTMEGLKSNVVGWWPSNPVESINGCMVSNLFQQEKNGKETIDVEKWDVPEGAVFPERLIERLKELRVHPSEISGNLVMPFVPNAIALDKKKDKRLTVICKFLAHASTIHAAATEILETEPWDFMAVYHDALDHFSHAFMKFYPPKMEGMEEESYELFKEVVIGAYVFHDMMLGRLLAMVDDDTTVVVVSDHGFHSDHLRPTHVPQVPSGPAIEHAPYGMFAARGPGIKKGERIYGASILDVTPTLLSLFDLPIGRDMDGKPLLEIYENPKEIKYIDSWENNTNFGGELVVKSKGDKSTNEAAMQQLIDLGYIDDLKLDTESEDPTESLNLILKENNFYLAKSFANGGKYDEALEILLEIENKKKPDFRHLVDIVSCALKTKRFKLAEEYLKYIRTNKIASDNYVDVMEAKVNIGLNMPDQAMKFLKKAEKNQPDTTEILMELGTLLNNLFETKKARECFEKVVKTDVDNAYAQYGIGISYLREENYEEALEYFLNAIDRNYYYPLAHFHLGETLALMKEYDAAIGTFELVRTMSPELLKIYRWLLDLYSIKEDTVNIKKYEEIISKYHLGEKIIITGLPGRKIEKVLSELVKLGLEIGGDPSDILGGKIEVLDKDWFSKMKEKIIYLPINYIASLNAKYSFRILYINDELDAVIDDTHKKIKRKNNTFDADLIEMYSKHERVARTWMSHQPNLDILYINNYKELSSLIVSKFLI